MKLQARYSGYYAILAAFRARRKAPEAGFAWENRPRRARKARRNTDKGSEAGRLLSTPACRASAHWAGRDYTPTCRHSADGQAGIAQINKNHKVKEDWDQTPGSRDHADKLFGKNMLRLLKKPERCLPTLAVLAVFV